MPPTPRQDDERCKRKRRSTKDHQRRVGDSVRELIIDSVIGFGKSRAQVARQFSLHWSTVDSIVKKFEDTGIIHCQTNSSSHQHQKKLRIQHIMFMCQMIAEKPGTTLEEIQLNLLTEFPEIGSIAVSTIQKTLTEEARVTCKRLHMEPVQYNHPDRVGERKDWIRKQLREDKVNFNDAVFVDECGFNVHTTRLIGRTQESQRVKTGRTNKPPCNVNLCLAASANDGVICHRIFIGTCNKDRFSDFLKHDVFPKLSQSKIIIVTEHSHIVKQMIQESNHRALYVPKYTPWFNLCEWVFGKVKPYIGRQQLKNNTQTCGYVLEGINRVTRQNCQQWLNEVLHWMSVASQGRSLGVENDIADTLVQLPGTNLWREDLVVQDPATQIEQEHPEPGSSHQA